ncbi:UDP-glycosyltransferase UGT5-like [Zerene cesonia]|uniref:UDP-glycosyltransferase UGT5-like n=1 Tax=Zerene cesonia TaxID=33412 RepID=UPI0018E4E677|nr:UDP-glycosyltransferase UGT5-like [Zerene cesonia]
MHELVKRGHEVTIITAEPQFLKENAPINLTEINIHDVSYEYYKEFNSLKIKAKSAFEMSSYMFEKQILNLEIWEDQMLQRVIGNDVPPLRELKKNVVLYFLNTHRIWDANRPVPPNVIYLGGLHLQARRELPKDLSEHLDSSVGVIYTSFGTNVDPSTLPPRKIKILSRVLSELPYTVLWKWNKEKLPGHSKNIVTSKWFPQADLLHHPKMRLFISQGGLQSTEEAIDAGIPLLGIPLIGDQWYNVEKYEHFKIGLKVDLETITEGSLKQAIDKLINDSSYRQNIIKLRQIIRDQPQSALKRAVWWTEYALRHSGNVIDHLHPPVTNISWINYYELELVLNIILCYVIIIIIVSSISNLIFKVVKRNSF